MQNHTCFGGFFSFFLFWLGTRASPKLASLSSSAVCVCFWKINNCTTKEIVAEVKSANAFLEKCNNIQLLKRWKPKRSLFFFLLTLFSTLDPSSPVEEQWAAASRHPVIIFFGVTPPKSPTLTTEWQAGRPWAPAYVFGLTWPGIQPTTYQRKDTRPLGHWVGSTATALCWRCAPWSQASTTHMKTTAVLWLCCGLIHPSSNSTRCDED